MSQPTPSQALKGRRSTLTRLVLMLLLLLIGPLAPRPASAQTGSISGFVVDTLGNRVSGATIRAISGPSAPAQTTSAADGSYLLSRLIGGTYIFTVTRAGFTGTTRSFTVVSGVSARLDFTIRSETTQGGVVQGRVLQRGTSTPVAGARVVLTGGAGQVSQTAVTDENGTYQFSNLNTGRVRLTVTRAGYFDASRQITVTQGRTVTADFDLRLRASQLASLSGVVTDTNGTAIRGAVVTLSNGTSAGMSDTTDSRGRYSITRIIPDTYTVTVSASGFNSTTGTAALDQGGASVLNFSLTGIGASTAGITGLVVDGNGQPIIGARVTITGGPVTGRTSTTDGNGQYQLLNLPAGTYTLRVNATGFQSQTQTVFTQVNTTSQLDFTLTEQVNQLFGSIAGRVTRSDGTALPGVTVRVTAGPSTGQVITTDDQGNFSILDLPIGTYALTFSRSGFSTRTITNIEVFGNTVTSIDDVALAASSTGAVLSGTVTDTNGNPISSVLVRVLQNNTVVASTTTGAQGTYSFSNLAAGTYVVQFSKTGFTTAQVSGVAITTGDSVTVNVQLTGSGTGTGTITGLVVDPLGRPVQGATISLNGPSGTQTATTDANGVFEFDNLTPGSTYSLTVTASGFLTESRQNITVAEGDETNLRIQLRQDSTSGGSLSGLIRAANGVPIPGATVTIVGGPAVGQSRTTSSTGQFSFAGLPGGAYTINVSAAGFRPARLTVNVRVGAGAFVTVTLRR